MTKTIFNAITLGAVLSVILSGCGSTTEVNDAVGIITNDQYVVNLDKAEVMPSKSALQGKRLKVVVLPTRNNSQAKFESGAVRELSSKVENGLISAGVEIVDRRLAGRLTDEIEAYEATGNFAGGGISVADIAILPSINNVQVSGSYSEAHTYYKDGKAYTNPASCNFTSAVSGNVKLYKLPELGLIDGITLEGTYKNSGVSGSRSCPINTGLASSLASSAAEDAINSALFAIQSHMSGRGYVIEYRKREDEHLVLITAGSSSGIKPGQNIQFIRQVERVHPMTGKKEIMEVPYSIEATVSDLVEASSAWVIVDEEAELQLKFGDVAKQLFAEKSILEDMMGNLKKNFN